jgi:secreted PhoX family phosphatase
MMGGEPADGGAGWANPDNLELDDKGNLWMVTDISSEVLNQPVIDRDKVSNSSLRGIYSNNNAWFIPTSGPYSGQSFPFAIGPTETELCGLQFSADQRTLFLTPQHPGVFNGIRKDMAFEERRFALKTTDGREFFQVRKVPIGSNWPSKEPNQPPRPSIVAVRRKNNKPIV